jgi:hypothetical protein
MCLWRGVMDFPSDLGRGSCFAMIFVRVSLVWNLKDGKEEDNEGFGLGLGATPAPAVTEGA